MAADRQALLYAVVITVVISLFLLAATRGDWATTLVTAPLVMTATYWSMRLSKRLSRRYAPPPRTYESEARTPIGPTSERPEHAQRRRSRRRPRGRRTPERR